MGKPITLYIADDHQIVIDGLQLLISSELNFRIVGTANNWETAYDELLAKKPDVAILDINMPPGIESLMQVIKLKKYIDTKIIILSMYTERKYINDSMNFGASGYLFKNIGKSELIKCIYDVVNGKKYFPSLELSSNPHNNIFTPRESEILKMILNGATTQEIAESLFLSPYTIETHRKNICRKANTRTVLGLSRFVSDNDIDI